MKALSITTALVSAFALLSTAATAAEDLPGHQAGSQYTATFHQHAARWQLTPADGQTLDVSTDAQCGQGQSLPTGVWLLTTDADGQPTLMAPSAVNLPAGHSGQLRLVECDQAADGTGTIAAPRLLLDLLTASSGAVRIDD